MKNESLRNMILASFFAVLTAAGALVRIPVGQTDITLQYLFTAIAGILLGYKWGAASQIVYVLMGLLGLPVFARGGGISYVLQPGFGFVLGLIPAAALIGKLERRGTLFACAMGLLPLYTLGLLYMALICNHVLDMNLHWSAVIIYGALIYLPGDIVKLFLIISVAAPLRKAVARIQIHSRLEPSRGN